MNEIKRYSKLTDDQINLIADHCESIGVDPFDTDFDNKYQDEKGNTVYPYKIDSMDLSHLPLCDNWKLDVAHQLSERRLQRIHTNIRNSFDAIEHQGIRQYLIEAFDKQRYRGFRVVEQCDLRGMTDKYHRVGDSGGVLKLSKAIKFAYSQEAYADHSFYAVPVEGEITDREMARANLGLLIESWRTHNGFAGSGSSYSATLYDDFVIINCRASIGD